MPWFAERSVHLSLLAVQALGIPVQVPTGALLLPHPARTEGQSWGLGGALAPHLQKRPLGLAWSGEVPGDGHGVGHGSLCGIKETTSTRSRSLSGSWELDCSELKCCLCYSLVVWPHANGLTSRILRFLLCYKEEFPCKGIMGIMTPVSCYLMSRAYAKHLACSKVSLTCVGSF